MKDTTPLLIDFVVPYVNNKDIVWRNDYINFCKKNNLNQKIVELLGNRYGGLTFIYYQLQLINKNMPWINKIYLLLSNKEQVIHSLLPKNVVVVYHNQFIPNKYLPTFNSTTIEMFLWNIKDLSEHFIYANDDMLPIRPLKPSDFFGRQKIKINWRERDLMVNNNVFGHQCYNNCVALTKELKIDFQKNYILLPIHSFTPMIKSHCVYAFELIKNYILPHIRAFRTEYQYNQYIYPLYERFKYGTLDTKLDFLYTELREDFDFNHDIICVNEEKNKEYVDKFVKGIKELCE